MSDVFLSYSRTDRARAERLAGALQGAGFDIWWDRQLSGGIEFSKETEARLNAAKAVVVLWSASSVESNWVADEATVGRDNGVLVPILVDDIQPKIGFRQFQTIDFRDWRGDVNAAAFGELCAALRARISGEAPAAPRTRPARRPLPLRRVAVAVAAIALTALIAAGLFLRAGPHWGGISHAGRSVAVLPFDVLSSDPDDGFFADGLAEEILNALSVVPELLVTARTSSFHFKGQQKTIPEIAAALGVANIVEGSIRRSAGNVRINVHLVRAADGRQLWSETYDAKLADDFVTQSDIAANVAAALGVLLDDKAKARMADARVGNVEAFTAYQKGAKLWYDAHGIGPLLPGLAAANVEFDKAIALEPRFADAQLMRSDLHYHAFERLALGAELPPPLGDLSMEEHLAQFRSEMAAASRDARTPGRRAMAEFALAFAADDWKGLGAKMDAALASEECIYLHWVARTTPLGRTDAALAFARRRNACDPYDPGAYGTMAGLQIDKRDFDGARETIERGNSALGERPAYEFMDMLIAALTHNESALAKFKSRFGAADWKNEGGFVELLYALSGDHASASVGPAREALSNSQSEVEKLVYAAWTGDEALSRRLAAEIDREPGGRFKLLAVIGRCVCGAPFPIDAAPRFAKQIELAGVAWPPPSPVDWPLKQWR